MAFDTRILAQRTVPTAGERGPGIQILANAIAGIPARRAAAEQTKLVNAQNDRRIAVQEAEQERKGIQDAAEIERLGLTKTMQDYGTDLVRAKSFLAAGDIEGARNVIADRQKRLIDKKKINPSLGIQDTQKLMDLSFDDPERFGRVVDSELAGLTRSKILDKNTISKAQFGGQEIFQDSAGTFFFGTTTRDPNTQVVTPVLTSIDGSDKQPQGQLSPVNQLGQTRDQKLVDALTGINQKLKAEEISEPKKERRIRLTKAAVDKANKAFAEVDKIKLNVFNLNLALDAVKAGAGTGAIESMLPSIRAASVALDNIQGRLGLDVIGAVTFGALSKGEMDLALSVALPTGLDGPELIKWINDKITAQTKLAAYLDEQAIFLSETDEEGNPHSVADWRKLQKAKQVVNESSQVLRFDAQGNQIQ